MATTVRLADLATKVRLTCRAGANKPWGEMDEWQQTANSWRCTLRYRGRRYSFDFWQGRGITGEPTAARCLKCLLSEADLGGHDFNEYCGELGEDTDSRRAYRTWRACQAVRAKLARLLGDEFETFLYADRS